MGTFFARLTTKYKSSYESGRAGVIAGGLRERAGDGLKGFIRSSRSSLFHSSRQLRQTLNVAPSPKSVSWLSGF
jgi:hypothetical protein